MTRYKWIFLTAVVVMAVLGVAAGSGILLIPLVFLLCAGLLSLCFLLLAGHNASVTFHVRERCIVQKELPVQVKMSINSPLPVGRMQVRMRFENTLFGTAEGMSLELKPGHRANTVYEMHYLPTNCGRVNIVVEQVVCFDLFGIFSRAIPKPPDTEVVVYPSIPEFFVRKSRLPRSAESGEQFDLYRHGQDVTEVFDTREYHEGDSLRSIHWKLSGKLDHLVVREFSEPTCYRTMLFYDGSFYRADPTEENGKIMNAVFSMAAALSKNMMEINLPHTVLTFVGGEVDRSQVDSRDSYEVMLNKLMYGSIRDADEEQMNTFMEMGVFREFSKIILVTGSVDRSILQKISDTINITAIVLSPGGQRRVEQQDNMEIIRIPVAELEGTVHAIEI